MNLLKKLMVPLIGSVVLGTTVMAAEYKVGDDMPEFSDKQNVGEREWFNKGWTKFGMSLDYDLDGDKIPDVSLTYRNCGGKRLFFALYDLKKEKLYLDKKPYDGKIDEVVDMKRITGRDILGDVPKCGTVVRK